MPEINTNMIAIGLLLGALFFFLILELAVPYRKASVSKLKRWLNNLGLGVLNVALMQLVFVSLAVATANYVTGKDIGMLNMVQVPDFLVIIDSIILMDLTLYAWHVLLHHLPILWRFHRVHHTDLDVDVSTAMRYHVGEVALNGLVRVGAVYFLGLNVIGYFVFECVFMFADQFRHTSVKMPEWFENVFGILFVPPSMHRVHHSVTIKERNTNFGIIFSIWDRFIGTLLTNVDQKQIWTGVDGHIQEKKLEIYHLFYLPFTPYVE